MKKSLRSKIKNSNTPFWSYSKKVYYFLQSFTMPAPKIIWVPIYHLRKTILLVFWYLRKQFWHLPLFKSQCEKCGSDIRLGTFLPFIMGESDKRLIIGRNVVFGGKIDFQFCSTFFPKPIIKIGDRSFIGHNTILVSTKEISIGNDCYIADGVRMSDSPGHPINKEKRLAKEPPEKSKIKKIVIKDNVWIGQNVIIMPGIRIGSNSIVGAGAVVTKDIPPDMVYGGIPAKSIGKIENN